MSKSKVSIKLAAAGIFMLFLAVNIVSTESRAEEKLWNTVQSYTVTKGEFKLFAYFSVDKKSAWVYRVKAKKKGASPKKLIFPKKIKKAVVTRIGAKQPEDSEGGMNVFGVWEERFHGIDGSAQVSEKIKTISMPGTVDEIVDDAFCGMLSLGKVKIPDKVKVLDYGTFADCKKLREVKLPKKLNDLKKSCFEGCKKLERMTISSKNKKYTIKNKLILTQQKGNLYYVTPNVKKVIIPDCVTTIETDAFADSQAEKLQLGKRVKNFQANSLTGSKIKKVTTGNNPYYAVDGKCVFRKKDKTLVIGIAQKRKLVISSKVERITNEASVCGGLKQSQSLKVLDIPASVNWLGKDWLDCFGFDAPDKTYFRRTKPPKLEFKSPYMAQLPIFGEIYVPKQSLTAYQEWYKDAEYFKYIEAGDWKTF